MKRTQIYLSDAQWRDLSRSARAEGTSVAELVRRAVDSTYRTARLSPNAVEAWDSIAGIWADRADIGDSTAYVRRLREDDRLERIAGAE
jgi:hypothetical protein